MVILDWQIVEDVKCFIVHLRNMLFQLLVPLSFTALLMLEPFSAMWHICHLYIHVGICWPTLGYCVWVSK
jgi:hypothetical protein